MTTKAMAPELLALLTPEQREAWERCQKATPGPWLQAQDEAQAGGWWGAVPSNYPGCVVVAINGGECSGETPRHVCCTNDDGLATEREVADSELIAHARQDLPDALLELAQTKQALAEAKLRLLDAQAARTIWMERSKANAAEYNAAYDAMCEIAKTLGCAEDWAAIKAALTETLRAQLAEVTRERDRLRAALIECAVPLEVLNAIDCELAPTTQAGITAAVTAIRAALFSAQPEPKPEAPKCEKCGGDGYYKGPRLGDEPCQKCNGTGRAQ